MITKCAAILRLPAAASGDLTVTGVAQALKLPKSTASRLLRAMAREGLLEPRESGRGFRPGALLVTLGRMSHSRVGLVDRLDELVASLVERFGHTGYVSVLEGNHVTGARVREGWQGLRVVMPASTRYPAFATSTGRALLARLDDAAIAGLHPGPLVAPGPRAPRTLAELMARIAETRVSGIAIAEGEANAGTGNFAVALLDPASGNSAAACISFPTSLCDVAERDAMRAALLAGARRIGALVGDPLWSEAAPRAANSTAPVATKPWRRQA